MIKLSFDENFLSQISNHDKEKVVKRTLDRGLGNNSWFKMFEKTKCKNIENKVHDHSMLLMDSILDKIEKKSRFYFDKGWLKHKNVGNV